MFLDSDFTQIFLENLLIADGPPIYNTSQGFTGVLNQLPFYDHNEQDVEWNVTRGLAQNPESYLQYSLTYTMTLILNTYLSSSQYVEPDYYDADTLLEIVRGEDVVNDLLVGYGKGAPFTP